MNVVSLSTSGITGVGVEGNSEASLEGSALGLRLTIDINIDKCTVVYANLIVSYHMLITQNMTLAKNSIMQDSKH